MINVTWVKAAPTVKVTTKKFGRNKVEHLNKKVNHGNS